MLRHNFTGEVLPSNPCGTSVMAAYISKQNPNCTITPFCSLASFGHWHQWSKYQVVLMINNFAWSTNISWSQAISCSQGSLSGTKSMYKQTYRSNLSVLMVWQDQFSVILLHYVSRSMLKKILNRRLPRSLHSQIAHSTVDHFKEISEFLHGSVMNKNFTLPYAVPVFNLLIPCRLETLQLTQEKEKSSVAQCSTGWFKKNFLECVIRMSKQLFSRTHWIGFNILSIFAAHESRFLHTSNHVSTMLTSFK